MRTILCLLILVAAGCARNDRLLTLEETARPTGDMIGASVRVRGFIFFHSEQTLLCAKNEFASSPYVLLVMGSAMRQPPENGQNFRQGFDGSEVIVRGVLKVGPLGPTQYPGVYIEVSSVEKANQSLEPTTAAGTSAAEQPLVPAAVVAHL